METVTHFRRLGTAAALASMHVLRPYLTGAISVSDMEVKIKDGTVVTAADHESEKAATGVLSALGWPILREESGWYGLDNGAELVWLLDPLDGTINLAIGGSTATAIITLYNRRLKQVVFTTIGEPATGRLWVSDETSCTRFCYPMTPDAPYYTAKHPCHVWDGPVEKGVVLIDVFGGFRAHGGTKQILTNAGARVLVGELIGRCKIGGYGSNGYHQSLVADGGRPYPTPAGVAGSITTAIGGPYDVAGVRGVLSAGGLATGLIVTGNRRLVAVDNPLDVMAYDLLVCANTQRTMDLLTGALHRAFAG